MREIEEVRQTIFSELISDDKAIRAEFLQHFRHQAKDFADFMACAFLKWRELDSADQVCESRAYTSALTLTSISLHILSLKLFLSGHVVASGNLFRQVLETISLALVCSRKDLGILDRFMEGKYSTNDAIKHVIRYAKKLGLKQEGVKALLEAQQFYHKYSHPTHLTISSFVSFSERGGLYVGAAFDEGKLEAYKKEVNSRVGLASVFPNFVDGVSENLAKW